MAASPKVWRNVSRIWAGAECLPSFGFIDRTSATFKDRKRLYKTFPTSNLMNNFSVYGI